VTEAQMKEFAVSVNNAFTLLESMKPEDLQRLQSLAGEMVGLRDTGGFNVNLDVITKSEIKNHRRRLAAAISAEKFLDGFVFACQIMTIFAKL
jgi:hypothetical protein